MKNIKTTIAGLIAGLPVAIDALITAYSSGSFTGKSGVQLALGVGLVLIGAFAKDHNTTGGTVGQTPEAKARVEEAKPVI